MVPNPHSIRDTTLGKIDDLPDERNCPDSFSKSDMPLAGFSAKPSVVVPKSAPKQCGLTRNYGVQHHQMRGPFIHSGAGAGRDETYPYLLAELLTDQRNGNIPGRPRFE